MNTPKQSAFSQWWTHLTTSWGAYSLADRRHLAFAFGVIGLTIAIGAVGVFQDSDRAFFYNVVTIGLIVAQGAIGACALKHQAKAAYFLALASSVMLAMSLV